ncbi:hypothetical protein QOZ80_4BG0331510 [Eleusine coracana subsp. coracana]|nr:hypothetical protein QOZ80_4BG0331510 [Eleusine coracana subsp. coracana]
MLAFHFIRALARIHRSTPVPRRTRTIRRAAYSSMARAANPRRVWSRALLQQMRARRATTRRAAVLRRSVSAAPATPPGGGARSIAGEDESTTTLAALARTAAAAAPHRQAGEPARADALRRLVPGGNEMEYSNLLEETADYVRCLRAQVQLMQGLVDLFSAGR